VDEGHAGQLLFSQDVAMKMDLRTYGGRGYVLPCEALVLFCADVGPRVA
jgi:hypothetical protein